MTRNQTDAAETWRRAARRLAFKLNLGLWLEALLPLWAGTAFALAGVLVWSRTRTGGAAHPYYWPFAAAVLLAMGGIQWLRSRRAFYDRSETLVWLEDRLRLNNRLSAASAGVGDWPSPRTALRGLVSWRATKLAPPTAFSVAVLFLAWLVPVPPVERARNVVEEPLSWSEMERALETLREEELVAEEALDSFEERLDELREQPPEAWFSHGSLEAGDSLEEELRSEMRSLAEGLDGVEAQLSEMDALRETAALDERRLRRRQLDDSIDAIDLGRALPLDRKLARQLKELARESEVRRLTDEELARIREAKERLYHTLRTGKEKPGLGVIAGEIQVAGSARGSRPGRGGVTRGPGSAPIELSDERTELGTTDIEALRNDDLSRAGFGDTVSIRVKEHEVDTSGYTGGYDAGAVASFGEGGDLIWSQSLSPEERRVLRKYFK